MAEIGASCYYLCGFYLLHWSPTAVWRGSASDACGGVWGRVGILNAAYGLPATLVTQLAGLCMYNLDEEVKHEEMQ